MRRGVQERAICDLQGSGGRRTSKCDNTGTSIIVSLKRDEILQVARLDTQVTYCIDRCARVRISALTAACAVTAEKRSLSIDIVSVTASTGCTDINIAAAAAAVTNHAHCIDDAYSLQSLFVNSDVSPRLNGCDVVDC